MNNRGVVLILAYMVIAVLAISGSVIASRCISDKNIVRRYEELARAFWIAEAGLSQAYFDEMNTPHTVPYNSGPINFDNGTYEIDITDVSGGREIKSTGVFGSSQRVILGYLQRIPHPFENTMSVGGDLSLSGLWAQVEVYDQTRISGVYEESGGASGWFADKKENQPSKYTTIPIPDYNNNNSEDFEDFVLFGQTAVASYPPGQVIHLQQDEEEHIYPDSQYIGKKIIFVEGSSAGAGDVYIYFDSSWEEGEDLTVISTGTITYIEPLQYQEDARLSLVAWDDYNEASIFTSEHESVILAFDDGNFVDIVDWGSTTGNIIVNDNLSLLEILTYEKFYFSGRAMNGDLPPGFEYLIGSTGNFSNQLTRWQEE